MCTHLIFLGPLFFSITESEIKSIKRSLTFHGQFLTYSLLRLPEVFLRVHELLHKILLVNFEVGSKNELASVSFAIWSDLNYWKLANTLWWSKGFTPKTHSGRLSLSPSRHFWACSGLTDELLVPVESYTIWQQVQISTSLAKKIKTTTKTTAFSITST